FKSAECPDMFNAVDGLLLLLYVAKVNAFDLSLEAFPHRGCGMFIFALDHDIGVVTISGKELVEHQELPKYGQTVASQALANNYAAIVKEANFEVTPETTARRRRRSSKGAEEIEARIHGAQLTLDSQHDAKCSKKMTLAAASQRAQAPARAMKSIAQWEGVAAWKGDLG
ncbi:unnamed protein product, partial [Prorocentrum cordatum]